MQTKFLNPTLVEDDPYIDDDMAGRPPLHEAPPFGQRLAAFRKARGLSQFQLAKLLGKSREMIDYYERRAKNPSADIILKVAEALEVSVNELLGAECKPTHKPGPPSLLEARLEEVRKLPRQRQKFVLDFINTILRDSGHGNGQKNNS